LSTLPGSPDPVGAGAAALDGRGAARCPARGELIEVQLEELDERGSTFGHGGGHRIAVRGGTLGARVRARVLRRRRSQVEAQLEQELERSPARAEPRCPHFASCGGCSFQDLDYPAQLAALGRMLARILAPLGPLPIEPVLGCVPPWHYRNKMDFTFGSARWIEPGEPAGAARGFALGLHARGHFHKVLDLSACEIAFAGAVPIVESARTLALERGLAPWDVRARTGLLRHLVLRRSWASGEILGDLVTSAESPELIEPYVRALLARHPELSTLVQHVNPGVALVAQGRLARVHRGRGVIEERIAGLSFVVSSESFFQTNTPQAERLVELVSGWAGAGAGQTVFDLYCGCGLFALALARQVGPEHVVGFELCEPAVADACANAARNGLEAVRFVAGDLARTLARDELERLELPRPDLCVVDPPRAGMHARVLGALRALEPRRIVYVSCNPRAALRDLQVLSAAGWRVTRVQPVDLFPHTPHLECVFLLERAAAAGNSPR
jgi:23S rRNA (uracil1939-C5)-methyltransferase